uniref:Alcohol dehydrogenase n=1 Tax=Timema genevievae TaxID=629358 RepID=A0A7R9K9G3_TIMGE|nr:unnamed protein product [Timema genevievae]
MGHEFVGVVHVVGEEVTQIAVGDNVAVDPNSGCNTCTPCRDGKYHFCSVGGISNTIGMWLDGGWAEFCAVPADQIFKLAENITLKQAALVEPLSCVAHGWDRILPIPIGSNILILGAGIIGNLWASVLHLQGHRRVIVSEPQEARRKLLQKLETNFEIISPKELKAKKQADSSWGVDLVIECSGHAPAIEEALMLLRSGGTLCIFGVSSSEARIRYIDYKKLGIEVYPLKDFKEAVRELKKGSIAKAIFEIN